MLLHTRRNRKRTKQSEETEKVRLVSKLLSEGENEHLQTLARTGLVNEALRRKVWPTLLQLSNVPQDVEDYEKLIVPHKYTDQVAKDVERSLWKLVPDKKQRDKARIHLSNIMNAILSKYPTLHYFQGFHDIASVLLLVCGHKLAFAMLQRLSLYHLRDHMNETMKVTMEVMYKLMPLLNLMDKDVHDYIATSGSPPFFCLSWVLTWFSHSIDHLPTIVRLFDFFLASSPYASLYMSAVIIVHRGEELKKVPSDASHVHKYLSDLPQDLPWEFIIEQTNNYLKSKMKPYPFQNMNDELSTTEEEATMTPAEREIEWQKLLELMVVGAVSVAVIALTHAH